MLVLAGQAPCSPDAADVCLAPQWSVVSIDRGRVVAI